MGKLSFQVNPLALYHRVCMCVCVWEKREEVKRIMRGFKVVGEECARFVRKVGREKSQEKKGLDEERLEDEIRSGRAGFRQCLCERASVFVF